MSKRIKILALIMIVSLSSCIREESADCRYDPESCSLMLKAIDGSGIDITSTGSAGGATLYLFDNDKRYLETVTVSAEDVADRKPIDIAYNGRDGIWVVAWSNLNGNEEVTPLTVGMPLSEARVKISRDIDNFAVNPGELYYGAVKLGAERTRSATLPEYSEITLRPKTARISIVIKGLVPLYRDMYHIKLSGLTGDSYDFKGNLTGIPVEYDKTGQFDPTETFFTSIENYVVFPSEDEASRLIIEVYRGAELIGYCETDKDGVPIIPQTDETSVVRIEFDSNKGLSVSVIVTDQWDLSELWYEW